MQMATDIDLDDIPTFPPSQVGAGGSSQVATPVRGAAPPGADLGGGGQGVQSGINQRRAGPPPAGDADFEIVHAANLQDSIEALRAELLEQ
eukprot:700518-Pyramimonas_sp.AAC.1